MRRPEKATVGVFGIGLAAYWPQFHGLKERLEGYQRKVEQRIGQWATVVSAGLVDDAPKGLEAGETFRRAVAQIFVGQPVEFLFAEGGFKRLVWMPKELKALLAADLQKRFAELGLPDGLDKIAYETVATNPQEIRSFMEKVGHPALARQETD